MKSKEGVKQPMTKFHRTFIYLILLILASNGLISCSGALSNVNIFTDKEEVKLGKQFSGEIEKDLTIYNDAVVTAYIDALGQRMARVSKRNNITYHFKVVDTEVVNAFALPGGYLYVNLGLIRASENESELAGVIGHEIGHVVGKHGAKQLTKQLGIVAVMQLVLGKNPNKMAELAAGVVATGTLMKYGRDAETEADGFAVQEMYAAGIDPEGMATFFEKLFKLQQRQPSQLEQIFSTHPPTTGRISNVRAQIASLPPKSNLQKDSPRFHEIKRRLPPPKKEQKK